MREANQERLRGLSENRERNSRNYEYQNEIAEKRIKDIEEMQEIQRKGFRRARRKRSFEEDE